MSSMTVPIDEDTRDGMTPCALVPFDATRCAQFKALASEARRVAQSADAERVRNDGTLRRVRAFLASRGIALLLMVASSLLMDAAAVACDQPAFDASFSLLPLSVAAASRWLASSRSSASAYFFIASKA